MKKSILLVEDDELDVICVQRTLSKLSLPYELTVAHNGKEAFDYLENLKRRSLPDVVMLDLNMPRMNGLEFLKNIRNNQRYEKLKVFVMTTSNDTLDRIQSQELGISGYIIKPMSYSGNIKNSDSMESFVQFHLTKIINEP